MNRRLFLASAAALPVAAVSVPTPPADLRDTRRNVLNLESGEYPIRSYDPRLGDIGRGLCLPIEEIARIIPVLERHGFTRYRGLRDEEYFQLYDDVGRPKARVWYAFLRVRDGIHQAIAFESGDRDIYRYRKGLL